MPQIILPPSIQGLRPHNAREKIRLALLDEFPDLLADHTAMEFSIGWCWLVEHFLRELRAAVPDEAVLNECFPVRGIYSRFAFLEVNFEEQLPDEFGELIAVSKRHSMSTCESCGAAGKLSIRKSRSFILCVICRFLRKADLAPEETG